jgi:GntR family transcriptional repressor for pyruvate dehydrogenase complex
MRTEPALGVEREQADHREAAGLSRESLADQVARRLLEIVATRLKPGDLLPSVATLSRQFGVSRPVIREALKALSAQGVITTVVGKGAIVQPVNSRLLHLFFRRAMQVESGTPVELMELRRPLEIQSAALAATRRTEEELAAMTAKVQDMRTHLDDLDAYAELDLEFHLIVAAATHNRMLEHLIGSIRGSLRDVIREGLRRRTGAEELRRVQVLHEAILEAIAGGDPEAAGVAMARHFDEAVTALVGGPGPPPADEA